MSPRPLQFTHFQVLAILFSFGVTAVVLRLMGRTWWCRGGEPSLWWGAVESFHNSQHLLDPYTFTHVLHGFGFYGLLWLLLGNRCPVSWRALLTVWLESAWEIFENTSFVIERYREATLALGYYGDSVANSLGDMLACVAGFALAAKLAPRVTIGLFLAIEGLLLLWLRDSLLLNVVMLIWPLEAIKQWQLGA